MSAVGDILFFLDADDVYASNYLQTAIRVYRSSPQCEFLFCHYERFQAGSRPKSFGGSASDGFPEVTDFGLTIIRTLESRAFVGAPTSCISLRRDLALRIFPIPFHEDWRARADDCIVFGASLAGARKFRVESRLVGYRVHGNNQFESNPKWERPEVFFSRQVALLRLFDFLRRRFGLEGGEVRQLAHLEFKTIPRPSRHDLVEYLLYVARNGAHGAGRLRGAAVMVKWYLRSRSR